MAIGNTTYSSNYIKVATLTLVAVLIIHIIGFSLPRWCTVEFTVFSSTTGSGYHAGLWQHCGCVSVICFCVSRNNDPTWMTIVKGLETLALIGYIISGIISLVLVFFKQNQKHKQINFFIVVISGALGLIGTIIYGVKMTENFDALEGHVLHIDDLNVGQGRFTYAFILCVCASCLCLLLCAPLFMADICSATPVPTQEASVHYTSPGNNQCYNPSPSQGQGNMPYSTQEQFISPPPYDSPHGGGIPYKC